MPHLCKACFATLSPLDSFCWGCQFYYCYVCTTYNKELINNKIKWSHLCSIKCATKYILSYYFNSHEPWSQHDYFKILEESQTRALKVIQFPQIKKILDQLIQISDISNIVLEY